MIAICVIVFILVRNRKKTVKDPPVKTEKVEDGITGAEVKRALLAWKPEDRYAIVVAEGAQLVYHSDRFGKDRYGVSFADNHSIVNLSTNKGKIMLWGINYGNVLKEEALVTDGEDYYSYTGLLKKDLKEKTYDGFKGKVVKKTERKSTNRYTLSGGITIPDDEIFEKKKIVDSSYREIGCVYYPAKLTVPDTYGG